jgi:IS30 family transposase
MQIVMQRGRQNLQQKVHNIDTLTLDNDPAFAGYKDLAETLDADIYFCDPYKSWQKGAIENGNRLLREKLPKGFEINPIEQRRIDEIVDNLNNRPMKVPEFMTPKEAF